MVHFFEIGQLKSRKQHRVSECRPAKSVLFAMSLLSCFFLCYLSAWLALAWLSLYWHCLCLAG